MIPSPQPSTPALSDGLVAQLARALASSESGRGDDIELALGAMRTEARVRQLPAEALVLAMKAAWRSVERPPDVTDTEWSRGYSSAVSRCLAAFFGEEG